MSSERDAADHEVTPQPESDVRAVVDAAAIAAARAHWPVTEPDRTIFRVLACARAAGVDVSDEVLQGLLPASSLVEIAAARSRLASALPIELGDDATLLERLAEPSLTFDEALACGLLDGGGNAKRVSAV